MMDIFGERFVNTRGVEEEEEEEKKKEKYTRIGIFAT